MTKLHKKDPIPGKKVSREELARFWDTHNVDDYFDELKPVAARFAKRLSSPVTIRLDEETLSIIRTQARQKGIGATTLIRMWVLERMRYHKPSLR